MGLTFSTFFQSLTSLVRWSKDQDVRILMLGLDSAGKVRGLRSTFCERPLIVPFSADNHPLSVTGALLCAPWLFSY